MKNLLNQTFLFLTSLFTLLALALPASAADTDYHFVAGTEFNPVSTNDSYFFLKDFMNTSNNNKLQFMGDRKKQDIVVCENSTGKVTLFNWNYGFNQSDAFHRVEDDLIINDEEYIVTTPRNIKAVKGTLGNCGGDQKDINQVKNYNVVKTLEYADKYMFIARPNPCHNTAVLHYTLDGMHENEDYEVAVAFTNISDITSGDLSINLACYVHYFKEGDTYNPIGNKNFDWNINARQNLLEKKFGRFTTSSKTKRIVVTIVIKSSPIYAVLGVDYIKINSKRELSPKTTTPTLTGSYNKCVTASEQNPSFSDYFQVVEGTANGTLRFYEDANLSKLVNTFKSASIGTKTYYYTYEEEGKMESDAGTLIVTVKPNETINISANPSDATLTCSVTEIALSGPDATTQYEWINPNGDTGLASTFSADIKGVYTIKGTGSNGCSASGTIEVKENKSAPSISAITSKDSKNNQTKEITCSETTLTITPTVSSTNVTYSWTGPDNFNKTTKTINVDKAGTYTLVVNDKTTGCPSAPSSITIEDKTKKPVIEETYIKNVSGEDILDGALTCKNDKLVLSADITCDNSVSYSWTGPNGFSKTSATVEVTVEGTYKLVVKDTKTGCQSDEREFYIQENKDKPEIEKIVATNSDGEETNVVTCTDGTLTITPTVSMRNVSYKWDNNKTTATITETAAGTYTLVVTNNTNGCPSEPKSITLTKDESVPTVTIKSFDSLEPNATEVNTLTCTYPEIYIVADVEPENVRFAWNGSENNAQSYFKVTEPGTYTLKVTSNVNGCVLDGIKYEIKQDTIKPVVKLRPQYKLDGSEGFTEFNCSRKEIELFADTKDSKIEVETYLWSNEGSTTSSQLMQTPGDYSVIVESANGCRDTSNITLTQNIVKPIISVESLDSNGEPRTVLTCLKQYVTLTTTLQNESELGEGETQFYWLNLDIDGGAIGSSLEAYEPAEYQAYVVGANGCEARENITITMDQQKPVATITKTAETVTCAVPNVTISATTDIDADFLWNYDGKFSSGVTEITVDKGVSGSLYVTSKTSGCTSLPYHFEVAQSTDVPVVPTIDDTKLNLCPNTGIVNLASFIQSPSADVQYTFYNEQGEKVDVTEVNTNVPNMTYSYKVTATAKNACESDEAEFDVVVDGLIDFDLVTSTTRVMVGGEETVATVVPSGVEADSYIWVLNGKTVEEQGTEYSTRLYVDTKYVVTGISRCDKQTRETSVEVVWPTAFTPYNGNGKNDDFAKGLPIVVFNRFYTKIFEGNDGWDGTINGSMNESENIAVPGVYYYSVLLPNGEVKKGTIEIIKID